jgi:hypothetical protein
MLVTLYRQAQVVSSVEGGVTRWLKPSGVRRLTSMGNPSNVSRILLRVHLENLVLPRSNASTQQMQLHPLMKMTVTTRKLKLQDLRALLPLRSRNPNSYLTLR